MSIIIAGTIRVPVDQLAGLRPHMDAVMAATRAEDGCLLYSYAEDIGEPGLIRIFEIWRDQTAVDAHFKAAHMAAWRAVWPQFGVNDRRITAYDIAAERPL